MYRYCSYQSQTSLYGKSKYGLYSIDVYYEKRLKRFFQSTPGQCWAKWRERGITVQCQGTTRSHVNFQNQTIAGLLVESAHIPWLPVVITRSQNAFFFFKGGVFRFWSLVATKHTHLIFQVFVTWTVVHIVHILSCTDVWIGCISPKLRFHNLCHATLVVQKCTQWYKGAGAIVATWFGNTVFLSPPQLCMPRYNMSYFVARGRHARIHPPTLMRPMVVITWKTQMTLFIPQLSDTLKDDSVW